MAAPHDHVIRCRIDFIFLDQSVEPVKGWLGIEGCIRYSLASIVAANILQNHAFLRLSFQGSPRFFASCSRKSLGV